MYLLKDFNKKMKRQLTDWETIFVIHIFYKGLVSKIYFKKIQKLKNKDKLFFKRTATFCMSTEKY